MNVADFQNLPDAARLWVYAANRPINLEEHEYIFARLSHFVEEWEKRSRAHPFAWSLYWPHEGISFAELASSVRSVAGRPTLKTQSRIYFVNTAFFMPTFTPVI